MFLQAMSRTTLVAVALIASGGMARAQSDACAILKLADVTPLLGAGTTAKPGGATGCTWTSDDGKRKLIASRPGGAGLSGGTMFSAARTAAGKIPSVRPSDGTGIGDKAFATLEPFGVVLLILKQDRVLQIQYFAGAEGTAKDLDALRPVAKAAAAGF